MKSITLYISAVFVLMSVTCGFSQSTLDAISPTTGGPGTILTLTGTGLTNATAVSIGGVMAASFTVDSPTQITAVVGNGGGGFAVMIDILGLGGPVNMGGFNYIGVTSAFSGAVFPTSFQLNWGGQGGGTSFFVDVSTSNTFSSYVPGYQNKSVGFTFQVDVTGLTSGTTYYCRVRSLDLPVIPISSSSNVVTVTTVPPVPVVLPPTNVTMDSYTANWAASAGATGYELVLCVGPVPGINEVHHNLGNVLTYDVTGLHYGKYQYYRVQARNSSPSDYSEWMTLATLTPPPFQMAVSPNTTQTEIQLWHSPLSGDPFAEGVTGVLFDIATDQDFLSPISGSPFLAPYIDQNSSAFYTATGLAPGTIYFIRRAYKSLFGQSDWSFQSDIVATIPSTPVLTSTTAASNSLTINWAPSSGATHYLLDVSPDNFVNFTLKDFSLAATSGTSFTATGLTPGTVYKVRLRARTTIMVTGESSPYSNTKTKSTLEQQPLAQATSLAFSSITVDGLTASFTNASGAPDGYIVLYRSVSSPTDLPVDSTSYSVGNQIGASKVGYRGTSNTFSLSGLAPGTTYGFDIFSYNGSGSATNYLTTAPLEGLSFTLSTKPANQPTALSFTNISEAKMDVSFTAAAGAPTGYLALRKTGSAPTEIPIDGTAYVLGNPLATSTVVHFGATTTFTDTALSGGTLYFYSVFAYNGGTNTYTYLTTAALSGSQITLPVVPTLNGPSLVTQNSFQLTWSSVNGASDYLLDVSGDDFASFTTGYNAKSVGNVTASSVTGLSAGKSYKARIRASNAAGATANSTAQSILTIPANPLLAETTDITTSSFTCNWTAVPGATGYLLDISIDNFSNFVAGYNGLVVNGTTYTATSLNASTAFKIRLRATNGSGASGNSDVITVTTLAIASTSPLAMGNISFTTKQDNATTQTLSISVNGGKSPYGVELKHKGILQTNFTTESLTAITAGNYSFAITPTMLDKMGVAFEAIVTDAAGATDKKTGKIYAAFSESQSPTLPFEKFGGTDETWNLFSIPYDLDNKSISSIFAGYDPDRHEYDWRIMRYRSASNDYVNFNTGQVKLGEAYWFNAKESLSLKVGAGQTAAQVPFVLSLSKGWNLIGNPYTINISWDKVLAANSGVTGVESLQTFSNGQQSVGDVLAPFRGGFVWSDTDTQISIDPVSAASGGRATTTKRKIENQDLDKDEWMIPIRLMSNGVETELGGFGMHPKAVELKDSYDAMAVPRFMRYSDLVSEHPDYFYSRFSTDVVDTQSKYTWSFTLASNQAKGISQLRWNQQSLQGKHSKLYLFDKSAGILVDMSQRDSYPIDLFRGTFQFDIHYGSTGEPFVPEELILGNAWPNPASSFVNIPVALPATSQEIDLTVYDIMGRPVATLAKGKFDSGVYTFTWDLTNDTRQNGNGLFIYQLSFPGNLHAPIQKKLILR